MIGRSRELALAFGFVLLALGVGRLWVAGDGGERAPGLAGRSDASPAEEMAPLARLEVSGEGVRALPVLDTHVAPDGACAASPPFDEPEAQPAPEPEPRPAAASDPDPPVALVLIRVVDARTGEPVPKAYVHAREHASEPWCPTRGRPTAEGLEIELAPGIYDIAVRTSHSGHLPRVVPAVDVGADAGPPLLVALEEGCELTLVLAAGQERPGGMPMLIDERIADRVALQAYDECLQVVIEGPPAERDATAMNRVVFDGTGRALVRGLAPGRYRLRDLFRDARYTPDRIEVSKGMEPLAVRWEVR